MFAQNGNCRIARARSLLFERALIMASSVKLFMHLAHWRTATGSSLFILPSMALDQNFSCGWGSRLREKLIGETVENFKNNFFSCFHWIIFHILGGKP